MVGSATLFTFQVQERVKVGVASLVTSRLAAVLVKVQVMSSPEPSSTDTPLAPDVEKSAGSLVPVKTHARPVSPQPAGTVSVMT